ncbi:dihydrolipoyl dehydrogenase [Mesorhizobium sp. L-8-10]|uniref:dihydrolipoyl dehydrogenase n=1 Tax=Mesorhizobium sp. L-8-10 TaxID=2744523 RepID=UPI001928E42C|nr:dihydrolipoyl dehydrogenase [Mesorhizobium sp. L-8-10]
MSEKDDFDVLVIGAGPGGYACAIRAAQLGLRTACADARETLGGTCLNVGCIPSKALLHASHLYDQASGSGWERFGVKVGDLSFDLAAMMRGKDETVETLTKGIDGLFRRNSVTRLKGLARFAGRDRVDVAGRQLAARAIVIATGSVPGPLPGAEIEGGDGIVVDSTGALSLDRVPGRLAVIGGGAIGLELGSVWRRLGASVTVVEYMDRILPGMDGDIGAAMAKILRRQGIDIRTSSRVKRIRGEDGKARLAIEQAGKVEELVADAVLVATGRKPNTAGLGLAQAGLAVDEAGFIPVDRNMATAIPGIFAIGDVTRGPMLAHRAEDEGIAVAERIAGRRGMVNHAVIPAIVYTDPEAAGVGRTEEELKRDGISYEKSSFPMSANSRARTNRELDGFVKILADAGTGEVLGAHIVSSLAGTMIGQVAQAMEFGATAEDIAYSCHAHPTHNEAIKEAALGISGRPIHI